MVMRIELLLLNKLYIGGTPENLIRVYVRKPGSDNGNFGQE